MGNKRFHRMTPDVAHLKPLVESQSFKVIAKHFGVTPASLAYWMREGKAPHWTLLGAEALNRRMGTSVDRGHTVLVIQVDNDDAATLSKMVVAMGGTVEAAFTPDMR